MHPSPRFPNGNILHDQNTLAKPGNLLEYNTIVGFPGSSAGKESTCNAGDLGSIPRLGRSPRGEHGNPVFLPEEYLDF